MDLARLGLLGLLALVIATMGLWNTAVRAFTARHREWPWAQALAHAY